jgi:hypothetical protein
MQSNTPLSRTISKRRPCKRTPQQSDGTYSLQARGSGAYDNVDVGKMDVGLKGRGPMFMAQDMLFAEHIVKLVDIYGKSFPHIHRINQIC